MNKKIKLKKRKKLRLKAKYRNMLQLIGLLLIIILVFLMIIPKDNFKIVTYEKVSTIPTSTIDNFLFTYDEKGIINYPNAQLGIDISTHQSDVDFSLLKQQGIDFVFIRLGYRGYQ